MAKLLYQLVRVSDRPFTCVATALTKIEAFSTEHTTGTCIHTYINIDTYIHIYTYIHTYIKVLTKIRTFDT